MSLYAMIPQQEAEERLMEDWVVTLGPCYCTKESPKLLVVFVIQLQQLLWFGGVEKVKGVLMLMHHHFSRVTYVLL